MSSYNSTVWNTGPSYQRCGRPPRRAFEIAGIILAFIWFWPLAVAYLVWKMMGYPRADEIRAFLQEKFGRLDQAMSGFHRGFGGSGPGPSTGNAAFDEYRRRELERLEEERRRLDEEVRAFAEFVEELKRAKDREEFDAFMAKRRADNSGPTTSA